jgi:hypothetical protein
LNGLISYCWSKSYTSLSRKIFRLNLCLNLYHNLCYKRVWGLSHLMIFNSKKENFGNCKVFVKVFFQCDFEQVFFFKSSSCMVAFGTKDNLKFNVCSKLKAKNSLYEGLGFMFSDFELCK